MDIILMAGLWLPASVWTDVVDELTALGHRPIPLELPGVDDGSTGATLDDQLTAAIRAVDDATTPLVVGHSAASSLAWLVADRRPEGIAGVVLVGGFPGADGSTYADFFECVDGLMAFPGWEPFEGPDSADLDDEARARIEVAAVPVPEGVAKATVVLSDERRYAVPTTLVCPEFGPDDVRSWIEGGDLPELERVDDLSFVDIDSGHWPMITRPGDVARILHDIAAASASG